MNLADVLRQAEELVYGTEAPTPKGERVCTRITVSPQGKRTEHWRTASTKGKAGRGVVVPRRTAKLPGTAERDTVARMVVYSVNTREIRRDIRLRYGVTATKVGLPAGKADCNPALAPISMFVAMADALHIALTPVQVMDNGWDGGGWVAWEAAGAEVEMTTFLSWFDGFAMPCHAIGTAKPPRGGQGTGEPKQKASAPRPGIRTKPDASRTFAKLPEAFLRVTGDVFQEASPIADAGGTYSELTGKYRPDVRAILDSNGCEERPSAQH